MDYIKESEKFNQVASYYDKYRPSYPNKIIDIIIQRANIKPFDNLLEIGSGSGKATSQFCHKNLNITCCDLGCDLVKIGNNSFKDECFTFVKGRFEELEFHNTTYDLVMSFQAFHWIKKPDGYIKAFKLLKKDGYLALVWNMYIITPNKIDQRLLELSSKYGGFCDFLNEEECEKRIDAISNEIKKTGLFESLEVFKHQWYIDYTASNYFGFLQTGNCLIGMDEQRINEVKEDIIKLANDAGGVIKRPYLTVLYLAKKKTLA